MEKIDKNRLFFERILLYLIFILGIIFSLTVLNAIFHYPTDYRFWKEPISRLGGIETSQSIPNPTGAAIFASGMQICAFVCIFIIFSYIYWEKVISPLNYQSEFKYHPNRTLIIVMGIMAFGAFLVGVPYDHKKWAFLHAFGTLLFIGGFCIFNIIAQLHHRKHKTQSNNSILSNITQFEAYLIILIFISIIIYVIAFISDILTNREKIFLNYFNATTQKISILLCLIALFNLDPDDVLMPNFWEMDQLSEIFFKNKQNTNQ